MLQKTITLISIFLFILFFEFIAYNNLFTKQQNKHLKKIQNEKVYITTIIETINNSNTIIKPNFEFLKNNQNIISFEKLNLKYLFSLKDLNINNDYFLINLKDKKDGYLYKITNNKFIFSPTNKMKEVTLSIETLSNNEEFITTTGKIRLEDNLRWKKEINKKIYKLLDSKNEKLNLYIKIKNENIQKISLNLSTYNLDFQYISTQLINIILFNTFILILLIIIIFFKKSHQNSELHNFKYLKVLEKQSNILKRKNNLTLSKEIELYNFEFSAYKINLKDKSNTLFEKIILDIYISNRKISNINLEQLSKFDLLFLNQEIIKFANKNNLIEKGFIIPIYSYNLNNEEFINWFFDFINKNQINHINFSILELNDNTIKSFDNFLILIDDLDTNLSLLNSDNKYNKLYFDNLSYFFYDKK